MTGTWSAKSDSKSALQVTMPNKKKSPTWIWNSILCILGGFTLPYSCFVSQSAHIKCEITLSQVSEYCRLLLLLKSAVYAWNWCNYCALLWGRTDLSILHKLADWHFNSRHASQFYSVSHSQKAQHHIFEIVRQSSARTSSVLIASTEYTLWGRCQSWLGRLPTQELYYGTLSIHSK